MMAKALPCNRSSFSFCSAFSNEWYTTDVKSKTGSIIDVYAAFKSSCLKPDLFRFLSSQALSLNFFFH